MPEASVISRMDNETANLHRKVLMNILQKIFEQSEYSSWYTNDCQRTWFWECDINGWGNNVLWQTRCYIYQT